MSKFTITESELVQMAKAAFEVPGRFDMVTKWEVHLKSHADWIGFQRAAVLAIGGEVVPDPPPPEYLSWGEFWGRVPQHSCSKSFEAVVEAVRKMIVDELAKHNFDFAANTVKNLDLSHSPIRREVKK